MVQQRDGGWLPKKVMLRVFSITSSPPLFPSPHKTPKAKCYADIASCNTGVYIVLRNNSTGLASPPSEDASHP